MSRKKKKYRFFATFLCFCMLFTMPGIQNVFPVVTAAEQDGNVQTENIITAFDSLSEDIKEQTVFIGTDLDELDLPKELTVCLFRTSSEQKVEESERENAGETDGIEGNSDTETRDEQDTQPKETGESEETAETTVTDNEDAADMEDEEGREAEGVPSEEQDENEKESVPSEKREESDSELSSEELEESDTAEETYTVTMTEYYVENVISVQTLENTQTENQKETVTIDGVTWQSEPRYDGDTEGIYTFTAVLPDGYILAEDVSLPEIMVTVEESGTDTVIQTLLNKITALPDAEEYLATEPDMDDEDTYADWEEKLYEYAEEALAIWEEYEALTEEQQAQITEKELAKLTAWVELAETFSDHAVMLAGSSEHHGESDWTALTASDTSLSGGKFYLADNIEMDTITITGDATLCLNGQTLTHLGDIGSVIRVKENVTFTLCDCSGDDSGVITGGKGEQNVPSKGYTGGGGICLEDYAKFIMSGGTISENCSENGGGIYVGKYATFDMSDGHIINNIAEKESTGLGGGIYALGGSHITITNGDISGNCSDSGGGGILLGSAAKLTLKTENETDIISITNNVANNTGGGIRALVNSSIELAGNVTIFGNEDENKNPNNIYLSRTRITIIGNLAGSFGVTTQWLPNDGKADDNSPFITIVQGGNGYKISGQDFARFSSDNRIYSVLMVEDKTGKGKVLVLGNESTGNLSDMALSIKDSSSGEEIKLSPDFAETTYEYAVTVPNSVKAVSIEATPKNAGADVAMTIQNADNATDTTVAADNIPLAEGENTIKVKVTEGDASKVYIIIITREEVKGNPVTITSYKDGVEWTGAPSGYRLTSDDGKTFLPGLVAPDGTYKIYIGDIDTGVEVTVAGAETSARVDYYTVTFYDGTTELTAPAQQIVLKGAAASAPTDNPTKTGYTFSKWVTADGGSTEYDFANETVTGKTLVYAGWTPVTYTITYDLAGGTLPAGKTNPADYTIETVDFTLQNPERTGYTFAGWSGTGLTANSTTVTISKGSTGNREYTANWTAKTYGITLNGNGGTGDDLTGYTYGQGAVLPANWTKIGYTFAGWYDNKGCTDTPVTEISTTATGDKEYWAKWTPNTYQVTFEYHGVDGGDTTASKNVTYDSQYGDLPVPTKTGYTFKGWYTAEAEGQGTKVDAETIVTEASAHTLHARWKDETAPDKPVLQDGVTLPTGWTNKQTTIPLKLYDGVGVTELWVNIDGKGYTKMDSFTPGIGSMTYNYTPVLEGEREPGKGHTYQFKAVDAADNFAESDTFTVKLDQTSPVIGTLTYDNAVHLNLWHWIIGKKSMVVHVPVTDTGSGVTEIRYTLTPKDAAGNPDESQAVEKTATVRDGEAKITFDKDFRGTIAISCTDVAGNTAAGVTIGTADTGGAIVEDHAPDITILADRNPADLQQTQQNGVAVSEEYYDSAPALLVTVKDDTGNAITAGIATVKYTVGDTEQSVNIDASALQAQVSFTISAVQIPTGVTEIKVTVTDNAGNTAEKIITVKVKGPEKQPEAKIDYRQEELTGLVPGREYLIDGETYTADQEGRIPVEEDWLDGSLSIVKKGNGSETSDSTAQSLPIPARPAKPTPTGVDVSTAGGTGKLTGLTVGTTYEISTDGGRTWETQPQTANGSGQIIGLAPGSYVVRVKVGAANFVSEKSEPATIGAYQIKVTFMVEGAKYKEIAVDYGTALKDIPDTPPKKDAGDQTYIGEWCSDEQGTPAVFTSIMADMTVYAVYTKAYTVTMQTGTGYTLSAQAGSKSPVKEGGSFTFRFVLANGYQKTDSFAVKVNGTKVELTADDAYTISDVRENKTVTVEGVAKKPEGKPSNPGGGGDKEDGEPKPTPSPSESSDDMPYTSPVKPPAKATLPAPGTTPPAAEMEPEGRKPRTAPEQEESREQEESGKTKEEQEPEGTDTKEPQTDSADAGQTEKELQVEKREVQIGDGTVIVTVVCEEEKCTATVADIEKVVRAVLTPDQQELVNGGETIEIRIDVTDISDQVPKQDKEVIEGGIEAYREEVPGLVLGMYVDISMFVRMGAGDWNAITATDEPIEVVIGIPEKLQSGGREFYIIRAHEGEYTFMNDLDDAPDTITVSTDLFSSYAIAYVETDGAEADSGAKCGLCHICPTFLRICYFIWLTVFIAMVLIIYIIWRKKRQKEEQEK